MSNENQEPKKNTQALGCPAERCVMLPATLTAENGAKALLIGEFSERLELLCDHCDDGYECGEICEVCNGKGFFIQKVQIEWTTIKEIYQMIVKNYAT